MLLDKERLQGETCGKQVEAAAVRLGALERDAHSLNPVQESWSRDTEDAVFMVGLQVEGRCADR